MSKTAEQIKSEFLHHGLSISGWAKENGYSQTLVYQILNGKRNPLRGESHKIAVKLGLKEGNDGTYEDLSFHKQLEKKIED